MDKYQKERQLWQLMRDQKKPKSLTLGRELFDARVLFDALPKTAWAAIALVYIKASIDAHGLAYSFEGLKASIEAVCEMAHEKQNNALAELLPAPAKISKL
jgi:uncharacterized alpha-E superfamily protein